MTISFKQLAVAAAATLTIASAQAGVYPGVVTEVFTLNPTLTSALAGVGSVSFSSFGSASFDAGLGQLTVVPSEASFTTSNASDFLSTAAGSGLSIQLTDSTVSLSDLKFDNAKKSLSGSVVVDGTSLFSGELLVTTAASTILAPFSLGGQGQLQTGVMRLTNGAASVLAAQVVVGKVAIALAAAKLTGTDFGTLKVTAVPEPSTYALMGLGLVGVALAARKRKAA